MISCLLRLLLGALMVPVALGGVWTPFVVTIPSFPFNGFLSLVVFISGQLGIKCSELLQ